MQLFWFPFAGAHSASYRDIQLLLPSEIENISLELPGHGSKMAQALLRNIFFMRDELVKVILAQRSDEYAFYGHSMGAILAYLCAKELTGKNFTLPKRIFFSGRAAPSSDPERRDRHLLPDKELIDILHQLGGSPAAVLQHEELMQLMLPILRSDFEAIENYFYENSTSLPIPFTVINGTEDVPQEKSRDWQNETTELIEFIDFPGGHFFIFEKQKEIAKIISERLL